MKKFLYKIFLFLLPVFLLGIPLDLLISHFLKKSNDFPGEFEVMNDIYNGKAECDIAIYGSSRAWVHVNPNIIEDSLNQTAYNFGIDGHNFWLQYLRHLEFFKHNKKPKNIILCVDIFTLQKVPHLYQPSQFLPYMLWNKNVREYTSSFEGYDTYDYYIPLVRYTGKRESLNKAVKNIINTPNNKPLRHKGFAGMKGEWNSDFENVKNNQEKYEIKLHEKTVELFEKFIIECKDLDIKLFLVYTPEYIEGQKFVSNRSIVTDLFESLALKHNVPYFDFSNDEICHQKELFYNATHLNYKGADIFTSKLSCKIKELKAREEN